MRFWQIATLFRSVFPRVFPALLAAALLLGTQTESQADGEPKRVLMLQSFGRRFEQTYVKQVQAVLPVRADAVHLQQVILNLALNAMDAMLNCVPGSRKITLETMLVGETEAEVSVSDTGPGIPNDKLKSVFDPFYTTKPHGTGLGLSIARTIIENYGGRIWAENKLRGAVFRFTLPLATIR